MSARTRKPRKTEVSVSSKAPSEGRLDTTAVFGSRPSREEQRAARFRQLKYAAPHVAQHTGLLRMWACRKNVKSLSDGVDVVTSRYGDNPQEHGHYEGVQTCGYVKYCPCCSRRISETRRAEMNLLMSWARAAGYTVQMMTLTARHGVDDPLLDLLTGIKGAKSAFHRHRKWREKVVPHLVGMVTAFEITGGGRNGWHPHFHVIVITKKAVDLDVFKEPWIASLRGKGLDGTGAGWRVQDASHAGNYVAKWGVGEEVTLTDRKKGRKGGMTPFELLASACDDGDKRSLALWIEYLEATPKIQVLRWSNGLKAMVGVDDISDEDAATDEKQDAQIESGRAKIPHEYWRDVVANRREDRRAALLDRAEEIGPEAAVAELIEQGGATDDLADLLESIEAPPPLAVGGLRERLLAAVARRKMEEKRPR